jgi:hypothetical protein
MDQFDLRMSSLTLNPADPTRISLGWFARHLAAKTLEMP